MFWRDKSWRGWFREADIREHRLTGPATLGSRNLPFPALSRRREHRLPPACGRDRGLDLRASEVFSCRLVKPKQSLTCKRRVRKDHPRHEPALDSPADNLDDLDLLVYCASTTCVKMSRGFRRLRPPWRSRWKRRLRVACTPPCGIMSPPAASGGRSTWRATSFVHTSRDLRSRRVSPSISRARLLN
jgi:hypothetical protein